MRRVAALTVLNFPVPQNYLAEIQGHYRRAEQWILLSKYAIDNGYPKFDFIGPMSTTTGNSATTAWNTMVDAMDARSSTIDDMSNSCYIQYH